MAACFPPLLRLEVFRTYPYTNRHPSYSILSTDDSRLRNQRLDEQEIIWIYGYGQAAYWGQMEQDLFKLFHDHEYKAEV
jgi:hypothetical protein